MFRSHPRSSNLGYFKTTNSDFIFKIIQNYKRVFFKTFRVKNLIFLNIFSKLFSVTNLDFVKICCQGSLEPQTLALFFNFSRTLKLLKNRLNTNKNYQRDFFKYFSKVFKIHKRELFKYFLKDFLKIFFQGYFFTGQWLTEFKTSWYFKIFCKGFLG